MKYTGNYKNDVRKTKLTLKKEEWMTKWEFCILSLHPELAGKLDWDIGIYQYSIGLTPADAAFNAYGKKAA